MTPALQSKCLSERWILFMPHCWEAWSVQLLYVILGAALLDVLLPFVNAHVTIIWYLTLEADV
jgi:hypothetical protein